MQFFYSPGSCSFASHIVLEESGVPYRAVRVDLKSKRTETGADYNTINPRGYVPSLMLDDGSLLCENAALLPYLGELAPAAQLLPPHGTLANYRVREWVAYVCVELHKNSSPLFRPTTPESVKEQQRAILARRFGYVDGELQQPFLGGQHFSVADAYLFVVLSWFPRWGGDRSVYPKLDDFYRRVRARPAVQRVIAAEGLNV